MLLNPGEDKNGSNNNNKEKLLHTDEENSKITNQDPNPSSLFGKAMNIDSNDDGNENVVLTNPTSEDDIVSDSFAVSFKANDPINNVSDKLKQEQNSLNERDKSLEDEFENFDFDNSNFSAFKTVSTPEPITDVPETPAPVFPPVTPAVPEPPKPVRDEFEDEFDNFEFDSSVSAFKPLSDAGVSDDKKESPFMASLKKPDNKEEDKKEESAKPVFKVGAPVDVEKTPEVKETDIDLKAKPFDVNDTAEGNKNENVPVFNDDDKDLASFAGIKKDDSKDDLFSKGDDLDFATSDADKKDSPFANADKPEEIDDSKIQTFGTVSSGVNAFKKQPKETKAEEKNTDNAAPSPFKKTADNSDNKAASPFKPAPAAAKKDDSSPFKQNAAPAAKKEEPSPFKQNAAPAAKKEEPSPFKQTAAPAAKKEEPSPFKQNAAPAAKKEESSPFKQTAAPAAKKEEAAPFNPNKTAAAKKENAAPFNPNKTAAAKKEAAAPFNPNKTAAAEKKQEAPAEKTPEQPKSEEAPKAEDKPKANKPTPEDGLMKKPFNPSSEKLKSRPGASSEPVGKMNHHNTSLYPMNKAPEKPPVDAFKAPPRTDAKPQSRPGRATTYVAASQRGNIAPVTTVSQKRHGGKESGKGGLIALISIIVVFVGVILVLSNLDKIKNKVTGNRIVETVSTTTTNETTTSAASSSEETTTTAEETTTTAEETTTTAEETTTTAEETTTTAEETTTTTTVEETTTTAEETTTTIEETTTTAAPVTSGGEKVTNFNTKIKGFSKTAGGFKFKIIMTNKSNKTASLAKSLNHVRISLNSSSPIKKLTCDGFSFSGSGKTFKGVPSDRTIAPGETVTYTVTAKCSSTPAHYGYNNGFFDWK